MDIDSTLRDHGIGVGGGLSPTEKQSLVDIANTTEANNDVIKQEVMTAAEGKGAVIAPTQTWDDIVSAIDNIPVKPYGVGDSIPAANIQVGTVRGLDSRQASITPSTNAYFGETRKLLVTPSSIVVIALSTSSGGFLVNIDKASLSPLSEAAIGSSYSLNDMIFDSVSGNLIFSHWGLYAYPLSSLGGSYRWQNTSFQASNQQIRTLSRFSNTGKIFAGMYDYIACVEPSTGGIIWQYNRSTYDDIWSSAATNDGCVVFNNNGTMITKINSNGDQIWSITVAHSVNTFTGLMDSSNNYYVGTTDGYILRISPLGVVDRTMQVGTTSVAVQYLDEASGTLYVRINTSTPYLGIFDISTQTLISSTLNIINIYYLPLAYDPGSNRFFACKGTKVDVYGGKPQTYQVIA
jgi:hypothetical protein